MTLFSITYNYNEDPIFFSAYKIVSATTNVTNIPGIESVMYKLSPPKRYYKVIYGKEETAEF